MVLFFRINVSNFGVFLLFAGRIVFGSEFSRTERDSSRQRYLMVAMSPAFVVADVKDDKASDTASRFLQLLRTSAKIFPSA